MSRSIDYQVIAPPRNGGWLVRNRLRFLCGACAGGRVSRSPKEVLPGSVIQRRVGARVDVCAWAGVQDGGADRGSACTALPPCQSFPTRRGDPWRRPCFLLSGGVGSSASLGAAVSLATGPVLPWPGAHASPRCCRTASKTLASGRCGFGTCRRVCVPGAPAGIWSRCPAGALLGGAAKVIAWPKVLACCSPARRPVALRLVR